MDVSGYRNSGELSDITVVVDSEEFHLHKFPLYVRSNYFKQRSSSSDNKEQVSKIKLEHFPGGSKTFAVIADYCYNKDVRVNSDNVIPVKLASEYLEMNVGESGTGLAALADNVLVDSLYQAKNKRDYKTILNHLEKASAQQYLAEKSELDKKLIEAFAENLNSFVKSSAIYDKVYDKTPSSYTRLHNLSLNADNLQTLNNLPLKWMNDLVRAMARHGLNNHLLSFIIQNYVDYNTGHPDLSNAEPASSKPSNLINLAADVIKAEKKLSSLADEAELRSTLNVGPGSLPPVEKSEPKPTNLVDIVGEIGLKKSNEPELRQTLNVGPGSLPPAEKSEAKPTNLVDIAGEMGLKKSNEPDLRETLNEKLKFVNISSSDDQNEAKPTNLVDIAGEMGLKKSNEPELRQTLNVGPGSLPPTEQNEAKPSSLIEIASDILKKTNNEPQPKPRASIAADIIAKPQKNQPQPSDQDKLKVITTLANTLNDQKVDAQFSLPWLLTYVSELHDLKADPAVKAAFNRWTWNAINDPKNSSYDLSTVKPEVMIQMAKDAGTDDKQDPSKLIDFVDRYISDLDNEKKLDIDTFLALASAVPKDKRGSFDKLALALSDLLERDPKMNLFNPEKQKQLLDLIDFNKLNESTLETLKKNKHIPSDLIVEAALNLCKKLRKELDDAKSQLKSQETYRSRPLTTSVPTSYVSDSISKPSYNSYSSKYSSPTTRNRSYEPRTSSFEKYNNYASSYDYNYSSYNTSYGPSYNSTRNNDFNKTTVLKPIEPLYHSSGSGSGSGSGTETEHDRHCKKHHHHKNHCSSRDGRGSDIHIDLDLDENTNVVYEVYSDDNNNECHDYFNATYSYSKVY